MNKIAVLTNLAYIIAGLAFPIEIGGFLIALGILSGVHHAIGNDFTLTLDYTGMYAVGFAVCLLALGLPLWTGALGAVVAGGIVRDSQIFLASLIATSLVLLGIRSGLGVAFEVGTWITVAYVFNYIGDKVHAGHHGLLHGSWHIVSAYGLFIAIVSLVP